MRRLHPIDAVEGGRADRAAAGLRAEGQRQHAIRHRGAGTGGGAARVARRVMRVAGERPAAAGGEFHGIGLAEDHRALAPRDADAGGVAALPQALVDRRVVAGRHVGGVDHVLHAERQAVQHAPDIGLVDLAGVGEGQHRVKVAKALVTRLALGNAFQAGTRQRLGGQRAVAQLRGRRRGSELPGFHGCLFPQPPTRRTGVGSSNMSVPRGNPAAASAMVVARTAMRAGSAGVNPRRPSAQGESGGGLDTRLIHRRLLTNPGGGKQGRQVQCREPRAEAEQGPCRQFRRAGGAIGSGNQVRAAQY